MNPIEARLESVLRSWIGTPHAPGQCCRGRAVDCRYFVCAVLDTLYGITAPLPPRLPPDTAANNRASAYAGIKQVTDRYPCELLGKSAPTPGDILIVRSIRSHPETLQHAVIVGPQNRIWHAGRGGVGYVNISSWAIAHGFKTLEKDRWATDR